MEMYEHIRTTDTIWYQLSLWLCIMLSCEINATCGFIIGWSIYIFVVIMYNVVSTPSLVVRTGMFYPHF